MEVMEEVFSDRPHPLSPELATTTRAYYERHLLDDSNISCFAVRETGEIVGSGTICILEELPSPDNLSGKVGYLMNIFVFPPARGEGAGRQIVQWLIEQAEKRGITRLMLETTDAGRGVYESLGFVDTVDYMIREPKYHPEGTGILENGTEL
ncbi:MAG: GNAT family N-acetyltransferase [Clostridia bacterium]|nr:GNAT family N-acetyltransferase [Clostridia bacterium]